MKRLVHILILLALILGVKAQTFTLTDPAFVATAAGSGNSDPYFANVSLLLHMNGTGATFTDSGPLALSMSAVGDTTQTSAQSQFGGISAVFDGTGDRLATGANAGFNMGTGDYTLELWIRFIVAGGRVNVLNIGDSYGVFITPNTGNILVWRGVGDVNGGTTAFNANQWYHIAVVRSGTAYTVYRDGISYVTGTSTGQFGSSSGTFTIGLWGGAESPNAYIDDYRLTKAVGRTPSEMNLTKEAPNQ